MQPLGSRGGSVGKVRICVHSLIFLYQVWSPHGRERRGSMPAIPVLGKQRQEDPWGLLARGSRWLGDSSSVMNPVSENAYKVESDEGRYLTTTFDLQMHVNTPVFTHAYTHVHTHTNTHTHNTTQTHIYTYTHAHTWTYICSLRIFFFFESTKPWASQKEMNVHPTLENNN